jgi:hypothetical protein
LIYFDQVKIQARAMAREPRRISIAPSSELAVLIKEAVQNGGTVVFSTGEASYRADFAPAADLTEYSDLRTIAHRMAGSLAGANVPGWESSEQAEVWVEKLRQADASPFDSEAHE